MSKRKYASLHAAVARSAAAEIHVMPGRFQSWACRVRVITRDGVYHTIRFKTQDDAERWAWDFVRMRRRLNRIYIWKQLAYGQSLTYTLLGRERLRQTVLRAEGRA